MNPHSRKPPVKRKKPTIEALRALLALHDEQTVTAASKTLELSQPVVTRKLEVFQTADACGAVLLRRTAGGVRLTAAAKAVIPAIRELVGQYDQLLDYLRGASTSTQVVRIGVGGSSAQQYLPRVLALIREAGEPCKVDIQIARGEDRILGVMDGRFDLAVVSHDPALFKDAVSRETGVTTPLSVETLAEQVMLVIARKGTEEGNELAAVAASGTVALQQLRSWELVGLDRRSGVRRQLEQQLANPDDLHFLAEGGGWLAAKECVRAGIGVAIVPLSTLAPTDREDFVIRRLSRRFVVKDFLIRRMQRQSAAQKAARSALKQAARDCQEETRQAWRELLGKC